MEEKRLVMIATTDHQFLRSTKAAFRYQWSDLSIVSVRSVSPARELLAASPEKWLVVTCHFLPEWDGIGFTQEIKKLSPAVKVVVVAAAEFEQAAKLAGADEFCDRHAENNLELLFQAVARHLQ